MVSHIRIMRIRCSLCDAGAFFCSDMRVHLMQRHCEKLHLAPESFVAPGTEVPCMDKKKADALSQLVDPYHPGRVMYTSGRIVSWTNPKAYYPDPTIEARILGKARPRNRSPTPRRRRPSAAGSSSTASTAAVVTTPSSTGGQQQPSTSSAAAATATSYPSTSTEGKDEDCGGSGGSTTGTGSSTSTAPERVLEKASVKL